MTDDVPIRSKQSSGDCAEPVGRKPQHPQACCFTVHLPLVGANIVSMTLIGGVRRSLEAALEMALPTTCGGCGVPGATWCDACVEEAGLATYPGGVRQVSPAPCPQGFPPTWAASPYGASVRK